MNIYSEMEAAMRADDAARYAALLHEDFEYVRHKSMDTLNRAQMAALLEKVWADGNRTIEQMRCLFENDDILVIHTVLSFRNGSREGAMIVNHKKDGRVIRTETGVSDLT
jgi:hypothetical protein